ncbi:MAG: amidohydrolase [Bacteroidetes bacterium CG23_combo_of_CG06-09_8_20_14_all_32_9]|nr:MAG: amidohydrolase [Bacteroidetes bacterium CG23_combo_of_CG06-09_8_20_14_all_32_9]
MYRFPCVSWRLGGLAAIFFLIIISSCSMKKKHVNLIVYNAKVYTVDSGFSIVQAFAVSDGKFVATGTDKEIMSKYESDSVINADGKFIFPGFFDAHCHFYYYGLTLNQVDLNGTQSFDEVVQRVMNFSKSFAGEWIIGRGWDQNDWEVKQFPRKDTLDKLFPVQPVFLKRIDGHAVLVNQKALDIAGIKSGTFVKGGIIEKKNGKLTGILIDNAIDLLNSSIQKPTSEQETDALLKAQEKCFEVGLTTVDDAGLPACVVQLIDKLQKEGKLKMRVYAMLEPTEENFSLFASKGLYITERLTVRSFKIYGDGALGSRGAFLLQPYSDMSDLKGFSLQDSIYYVKMAERCYSTGYQLNTHCIGDAANHLLLTVYAGVLKKQNNLRWRIEHAQVVAPEDLKLFKKYSIIPSVQPTHATSDMYWAKERLGDRVKYAYAYQDLLKQNGFIPLGSDFPVESINPVFGFYAAVTRQDAKGYPAGGFQPENKLSREQALRGMTIWAAYANFEETKKGSIEEGKCADFVILDKDIMQVPFKKILDTKVLKTFIAGERIY